MLILDLVSILFFLILTAIFNSANYALYRFSSYLEDENVAQQSKLQIIAKNISQNFHNYEFSIHFGYLISLFLYFISSISFVEKITLNILNVYLFDFEYQILIIFIRIIFFILFILIYLFFGYSLTTFFTKKNIKFYSLFSTPLVLLIHFIFFPLIKLLQLIDKILENKSKFETHNLDKRHKISDEVKFLIEETSKLSELDEENIDIVENVFEFSTTTVKKIMTPRSEISALEIDLDYKEIINKIVENGYSRYPVYKENIDNIIGILNVKNILPLLLKQNQFNFQNLLLEPVFVNENEEIGNILKLMKAKKVHLLIVKDEFDSTAGIVTMEDILEEIIGEIHDEFDEIINYYQKINENEYIFKSQIKISDFNSIMPYNINESEDYESLGGYLLFKTSSIPEKNDIIDIDNYKFIILESSKRKIETIKVIINNKKDEN